MAANSVGVELALQPYKNQRRQVPADQIHGGSISLWDIAKRSLPIHAYEPLSVLQVIGSISSSYAGLVGRERKTVDPMLGETLTSFTRTVGSTVQNSHHPPVSASRAICLNQWEWCQNFHPEFAASIDSATVQSLLPVRLRLMNGGEYSWNKVAAIIRNARSEVYKRQVKNAGKMTIVSSTGTTAELNCYVL
ncbi:hypothetical protein M3Y97_00246000 [Aphelenchoides bicaudatus]|nr:hypothetical protein M3Y97_00246000 [Aphelenchoides bicaudatus]